MRWRTATIWSGVARSPRTALATSPGRTLTIPKVRIDTAIRTTISRPIRRRTKAGIAISRSASCGQPHLAGLNDAEFRRHEAVDLIAGDTDVVLEVRPQPVRVLVYQGQHVGRDLFALGGIDFGNHVVQ